MSEIIMYTTDDDKLEQAATVNQQLTVQRDGDRGNRKKGGQG